LDLIGERRANRFVRKMRRMRARRVCNAMCALRREHLCAAHFGIGASLVVASGHVIPIREGAPESPPPSVGSKTYPADNARGAEIILRTPARRVVFIGVCSLSPALRAAVAVSLIGFRD
jgi:hypothetical protein